MLEAKDSEVGGKKENPKQKGGDRQLNRIKKSIGPNVKHNMSVVRMCLTGERREGKMNVTRNISE